MQTVQLKQRASSFAASAQSKATEFYGRHGKHVRLGANIGLYVAGAVVLSKATTIAGLVVGATLAIVGAVGAGCSVAEYAGSSAEVRRPGDDKATDVVLVA